MDASHDFVLFTNIFFLLTTILWIKIVSMGSKYVIIFSPECPNANAYLFKEQRRMW